MKTINLAFLKKHDVREDIVEWFEEKYQNETVPLKAVFDVLVKSRDKRFWTHIISWQHFTPETAKFFILYVLELVYGQYMELPKEIHGVSVVCPASDLLKALRVYDKEMDSKSLIALMKVRDKMNCRLLEINVQYVWFQERQVVLMRCLEQVVGHFIEKYFDNIASKDRPQMHRNNAKGVSWMLISELGKHSTRDKMLCLVWAMNLALDKDERQMDIDDVMKELNGYEYLTGETQYKPKLA